MVKMNPATRKLKRETVRKRMTHLRLYRQQKKKLLSTRTLLRVPVEVQLAVPVHVPSTARLSIV